MPNVLTMPAGQLCDPIIKVVFVKTRNALLHSRPLSNASPTYIQAILRPARNVFIVPVIARNQNFTVSMRGHWWLLAL